MDRTPRISINKLMEYMSALPSRQREIVDNQKNPLANKPKMAWCASARKTILDSVSSGHVDESVLENGIMCLMEKIDNLEMPDPKKRESKVKQIHVDIDAIKAFKRFYRELESKGFMFTRASKKPNYLDYSGVHVSVRPEIIVLTKSYEYVGCLKFYFTKATRLKEEAADFLCAILNHYADRYLSPNRAANPRACMVVDVFGERVFTASKNVPLHAGRIRKSCEEISKLWSDIPTRKPISGDDDGQLYFPE